VNVPLSTSRLHHRSTNQPSRHPSTTPSFDRLAGCIIQVDVVLPLNDVGPEPDLSLLLRTCCTAMMMEGFGQ
jgi:hypothetical protein